MVTMTAVSAAAETTAATAATAEAAAAGSVDPEALATNAEAMAAYTAPEEMLEMMEQEILEAAMLTLAVAVCERGGGSRSGDDNSVVSGSGGSSGGYGDDCRGCIGDHRRSGSGSTCPGVAAGEKTSPKHGDNTGYDKGR